MKRFRSIHLGRLLALAGIASVALVPGTVNAQTTNNSGETSSDLQDILAAAANPHSPSLSARASLPLRMGFARGGTVLYITPEVGVNAPQGSELYDTAVEIAKGFDANFIPQDFASLPNTLPNFTALPADSPVRDIYVFTTQGNVLTVTPAPAGPNSTSAVYTPLWQVSTVAWTQGVTPTTLTSAAAVQAAEEAGQVTVTKTPIIVECSVIFSLAPGGLLPDSNVTLDAASFAAGGTVTSTVSLPLQAGFYNNEPALYITPEVGVAAGSSFAALAHTVANGFNANFVPQAFNHLPGTRAVSNIYVFTNFTQGNVLGSAPIPAGPSNNDAAYSPLWQINLVSWNPGRTPRALTSQADILKASSNGNVTIVPGNTTGITVECSVILTTRGGLLPGAKITRAEN